MKKFILFLLISSILYISHAQVENACTYTAQRMNAIEDRLNKLNSEDPDLVTLHYYFLQDCIKELQQIDEKSEVNLANCGNKSELQTYCTRLLKRAKALETVFARQVEAVDQLFYSRAKVEFIFLEYEQAEYHLDRALQFNKHNVDALLMKAEIKFKLKEYEECLPYIKNLFKENTLTEEQENEIYSFSSKFYYEIYHLGDSLVRIGKGAYAIDLFQLLDDFCKDIPSEYCNDDYYHGILRSKKGIYESYIAIAKAAHARKNYDLERKFLDYAEEYLKANGIEIIQE